MSNVALADQVDAVEKKVEEVQQRVEAEKRSWSRRSAVLASSLALFISILSGGFNVYDQAVLRPSQANEDSLGELRRTIGRLTEINWKLAELSTDENLQKVRVVQMIANGEKVSLLQRADQIIDALGPRIGLSEYLTLSLEHLNFGDSERAVRYAEAGIAAAATPAFKAEAHRNLGRALFAPGSTQDLARGRQSFAESLKLASGLSAYQSSNLLVSLYSEWAFNEAAFGDCDRAVALYEEFLGRIGGDMFSPEGAVTAHFSVAAALSNQSRCAVPIRWDLLEPDEEEEAPPTP